jgi:hypothetical protein
MSTTEYSANSSDPRLEPRVAKLEVGLDRLTEDVRSLAGIVRDQGSNVEKQLQALTIAVTEAQAPKKTDWSVIISAVLLVMALGSAVFWPLNQTSQLNKDNIDKLAVKLDDHQRLDMHPVGLALVHRLEEQLQNHVQANAKELADHNIRAQQDHDIIRKEFELELTSHVKLFDAELKGLSDTMSLYFEKMNGRIKVLEEQTALDYGKEHDELLLWRQKAMGLNGVSEPPPQSSSRTRK